MIWAALYSTITFGFSVVVFVSYLIILLKNRKYLEDIKTKEDVINDLMSKRKEQLDEMRDIQAIINAEIYLDENGDIQWLRR